VEVHHFVNSFHFLQLKLELVEVGLEHFDLHIVHVVLAELQHSVPQRIGLLQRALHVTLLSRLVLKPHILEVLLNVLALQQVSEDQLVLVDGLLGDNQSQGPLHFVVQSECFVDFHRPRALSADVEHVARCLARALVDLTGASECFVAKSTTRDPSNEELLRDTVAIQLTSHVVFKLI